MEDKLPVIGIVARPARELDADVNSLHIMESYRMAVLELSGVPLMILPTQSVEYNLYKPNELEKLTLFEKKALIKQINLCDGIILPGGNRRYEFDNFIAKYCLEHDIPILGICLGMQELATCYNDIDLALIDNNDSHFKPDIDEAHSVVINHSSYLRRIVGCDEMMVNSRHRYKIINGGTLSEVAFSEDGVCEAIEDKSKKFAVGVQWHPENLMNTVAGYKILEEFIEKCKE